MVSTYPPDVKYANYFLELQQQARDAGKGLWGITVEEEPTAPSSQGQYCGSVKSDVYHYPSCGYVDTIKPENLIWFSDSNDARSKGYRPCKRCSPP
jgi:micrococcal nuclease